jgi:hypothetical protein
MCAIFSGDRAVIISNNKDFLNTIIAISPILLEKTYYLIRPEIIRDIEANFNRKILSMISKDYGILYTNLDKNNNPFLTFVKASSKGTFLDSTLNYTSLALISRRLDFLKVCSKAILSADGNPNFEDISSVYWIAFQNGITLTEALNIYGGEKNQFSEKLGRFLALR